MSVDSFEDLSLYIGITVLILFMAFIVWDLAKKSNAGKFGTAVLFFALGFGVFGFVVKSIIVEFMGV